MYRCPHSLRKNRERRPLPIFPEGVGTSVQRLLGDTKFHSFAALTREIFFNMYTGREISYLRVAIARNTRDGIVTETSKLVAPLCTKMIILVTFA